MPGGIKLKRCGFTLVETVLSVAIAALILVFLSRLLLGGMQMSKSGSAHLTNLLASDIILQTLIADLQQATKLLSTGEQLAAGIIKLERIDEFTGSARPGSAIVAYDLPSDHKGLKRQAGGKKEHGLFPDRLIDLKVKKVLVEPEKQIGVIVELAVGSPPDRSHAHIIKRFVYLDCLVENRQEKSCFQPVSF